MILESKLRIPNISETIYRERLHRLLKEASQKKLITVIAPAGYGKTVFVAQTVKQYHWNSVWYRLSESDRNLGLFLHYLLAGIRKVFPCFGEKLQERIKRIRSPRQEWQEVTILFVHALESEISECLYIILEDYHRIQKSWEITQSLDFLFENLPPNFHIVLISRHEPELSLTRMRSNRELLEVTSENLAFTEGETDCLCQTVFGVSLNQTGVKALRQKTGGWATGLILFFYSTRNQAQTEVEHQISELKGSSKIIADYLQENVFENLEKSTRDFLLKSSILSFMEVDFCNRYLQISDSREILTQLEHQRLFTFLLDEERESYCYHDLFREFLLRKLHQTHSKKQVHQLYKQAASILETASQFEEALDLLLTIEEYHDACMLFEKCINIWLQYGRYYLIGVYSDRIPKQILEKYPWYMRIRAFLTATTFDNFEAQKQLIHYLEQSPETPDENTRHAQFFLAVLRFELGEYQQAETELAFLCDVENLTGPIQYELKRFQTLVAASLRKSKEADRFFADFRRLIDQQDMDSGKRETLVSYVQCRRFFIAEDYVKTIFYGEQTIRQSREMDLDEKDSVRNCYVFTSYSLFFLGRFAEGLEKAEEGLKWIEDVGIKDILLPEVMYPCLAANSVGLGKIEEGISFAQKGLQYFTQKEFYIMQARLHWILSEAYFLQGNLPLAEKHVIRAVQTNPAQHPKKAFFEMYRQHMNLELENIEAVREYLQLKQKKDIPASEKCERLLLQAHYYISTDKKKMALRRFRESLQIMEEHNILPGLISSRTWFACLLAESSSQVNLSPFIQKMLSEPAGEWRKKNLASIVNSATPDIQQTALRLIELIPAPPAVDLTVSFFGAFTVRQGDQALLNEQWKSKQAKTLFQYLALQHSKGYTSKDILMELLWPDISPKTASKRLHVILAVLRKTLEPEIPKGTPSSYIIRKGDGYRLNLGETGKTDVDTFTCLVNQGAMEKSPAIAADCYQKAEAIYQGAFLEETPYEEWCIQERERLQQQYLNILIGLMDYYEEKNDFPPCIHYAEKYLSNDPCEEDIYRRLMRYHLKNHMPGHVTQIYTRCRKKLAEELDSPVSAKTEQLYQKIVSQYLS